MSDAPRFSASTEDALREVAKAIYQKVKHLRERDTLEVEMRLCTFDMNKSTPATASCIVPMLLPEGASRGKIECGVSNGDFDLIQAHLLSRLGSESNPPVVTDTEDVTWNEKRYTYLVTPAGITESTDGSESQPPPTRTLVGVIAKRRLSVQDVLIHGNLYDVRLSINEEEEKDTGDSKEGPARQEEPFLALCYTRRKHRISIVDGNFRYDITQCLASNGLASYEVEVEGILTDVKEQLTEEWVHELLTRAVELSRVEGLKGLERRPRSVGAHRGGGFRGRGFGRGFQGRGRGGWGYNPPKNMSCEEDGQ